MRRALWLLGSVSSLLPVFAYSTAEPAQIVLTDWSFGIGDLKLMMATVLLTLVIYNLLVFLKSPHRDHFHFCSFGVLSLLLLLFCGEVNATQEAVLPVFSWPVHYHAFLFAALAAAIQFQLTLMPVRKLSYSIWSALQLLRWLALALMLLSVFDHRPLTTFLNQQAFLISLAFTLALALTSLILMVKEAGGGGLFLSGWLILALGLSLNTLADQLPATVPESALRDWLSTGVYIGATLCAVIFSLILPASSKRRFQLFQQGYQKMETSLQRHHHQRRIYHDAVRQYLHNIPSMDEKSVSTRLVEVLCHTLPLKTCAVISCQDHAPLITATSAREQQFFEQAASSRFNQLNDAARHGQITSVTLQDNPSTAQHNPHSYYALPVHWDHNHWILVLIQALPGHTLDADQLQLAMDISNHACTLFMASHSYRRLQHEADADSLTGVLNRRAFFREARAMIHRLQDDHDKLSLLYMDIDQFKPLNDNHGHAFGDHVLKQFTEVCRDNLRDRDLLARVGGEEFVVLLPTAELNVAVAIAERIRNSFQALQFSELGGLPVTVSIGVVGSDCGGYELRHLLARADKALYQAKSEGRNRTVTASDTVAAL